MIKILTLSSSILIVLGLIVNDAYSWSYEDQFRWGQQFKQCNGFKQSPINIDPSKVKVNYNLNFQINGLDRLYKSQMKNNGHTVQLELLNNPKLNLTGTVVANNVYQFVQLHFHWGKTSARGSEHSINYHFYPIEMHIVFYNKKYDNFNTAVKYNDGLVVIGTFFKNDTFNYNFQPLLYSVHEARGFNSQVNLPRMITFRQLLPKNIEKFYTYPGSLTTPPCDESVTWIVLAEPISFSERQLKFFRHLETDHVSKETGTNKLVDNYRKQVPTGHRIVQSSFGL